MNGEALKQAIATNSWIQRIGGKAYDITIPTAGYTVLDRASLRAEKGKGVRIFEFGTSERLSMIGCQNNNQPTYHTEAPESIEFNRPLVAEIQNARIVGEDGIVITNDGEIVMESLYNSDKTISNTGGKLSITKNLFSDLLTRNSDSVSESNNQVYCPLANNWSQGYFHWIADCLTKIEYLRFYEEVTGRKPTILISPNPPQWKVNSLKAAGYSQSDWEVWHGGCRTFDRILVPSLPRVGDFVGPRSVSWLADTIGNNSGSSLGTGAKKIYISRRRCSTRYVTNEAELLEELDKYGFVPYILEDLSFREQVDLFSDAEIVIGPHGAGFTNTVFADDLTLVEFFGPPELSHSLCYYGISSAKNFNYGALRVSQEEAGLRPDPKTVSTLIEDFL